MLSSTPQSVQLEIQHSITRADPTRQPERGAAAHRSYPYAPERSAALAAPADDCHRPTARLLFDGQGHRDAVLASTIGSPFFFNASLADF